MVKGLSATPADMASGCDRVENRDLAVRLHGLGETGLGSRRRCSVKGLGFNLFDFPNGSFVI